MTVGKARSNGDANEMATESALSQQVRLPNGDRIVLIDRLSDARTVDRARNVHRIDGSGQIVWTISTRFDSEGNPFTQLHFAAGRLTAYRWDGGTYTVDMETGIAEPQQLDR